MTSIRPRVTSTRPAAVAGLLVAAVMAATLAVPSMAHAEPDSLSDAKAKAKALAIEVDRLEIEAGVLGEDLAAAQADLGKVVAREISAAERLAELSDGAQASRAASAERVRALYMSGGQTGLYASVLDGRSLGEVFARMNAIDRVLQQDRVRALADATALADAAELQTELTTLSSRQIELEATARTSSQRINALLSARETALAEAGSEVARLSEAWRQAQEAAAARRAVTQFAGSGPRPTELPSADTTVGAALRAADSVLGVPYVYGASGPNTFDCSGLTSWAYAKAGLSLPRTSRQQWWVGPHPALDELQPGDLLFWANNINDPATIHHVAMYVGSGWMLEAPRTGEVVRYSQIYLDGYIGATRPNGSAG